MEGVEVAAGHHELGFAQAQLLEAAAVLEGSLAA